MNRTVVVTGASSGFGLATALGLSARGFRTLGLVPDERGAQVLEQEARCRGVDLSLRIVDLADSVARSQVVTDICPWALVNNAGYMNAGQIRDVPLGEARRQLEAMVVAPVDLILQALPGMLLAGEGRIVNVTSSAAHASTPMTGWYQAAKAALRELNDSLRLELRETGVRIVDLEPGGYRTGIWARGRVELSERRDRSARPDMYDLVLARLARAEPRMADPSQVADAIIDLLTARHPPRRRRIGPGSTTLRVADSLMPDRLWDTIVDRFTRSRTG